MSEHVPDPSWLHRDGPDITLADLCEQQQSEIDRLKSDLAAHKAALADVVERAVWLLHDQLADRLPPGIFNAIWPDIHDSIYALAPPDAAPYAKVLEAARRYDEARIARPLLYAKKRAEYRLLDNLTVTYLREADEPLAQAQADLHEALAAIEEPRR